VACALLLATIASLVVRTIVGFDIDVAGTVTDSRTHKSLNGARIVAEGIDSRTNTKGSFNLAHVPRGTKLRFSAENYRDASLEASDESMQVSLVPIPVTGTIKSSFTGKGIGATVRGVEMTKTKSDGTFTTYGVGPGDTVTVTAFGHAPARVKVAASRSLNVTLKLGRIDPNALLKPVEGYGYVDVPGDAVGGVRAAVASIDPEAGRYITGVAARSITKNGKGIGFAVVVAVDPGFAALPGFRDAFFDGFSSGATKQRDLKIGTTDVRFAEGDGAYGYAWQRFGAFVTVIGEGAKDMKAIAESLIGGKQAVPFDSI
jgi:hypothetical protein